jgi:branched-chain amino acid transport system permease protein
MYWVNVGNLILIFFIFAISLNLLMGYAGQVSVAQAAFGAAGAYAAAYLATKHGWSFLPAVGVGMAIALVIGLLVSLAAEELTSDYLILLTLAVQSIILVIITGINAFGGQFGIVGVPSPSVLGFTAITPTQYFWLLLVFAAIVFVICWAISRSRFGLVLKGIREDQLATQSLGKNVFIYKVTIFGIAATFAGLAGVLYAYYEGTASPGLFGIDQSIAIVAMVVIGGRGNLLGSLLGAGIVVGTEPFFEKVLTFSPDKAALVRLMVYGLILIVVMRLRPQGLLPEGLRLRTAFRGRSAHGAPPTENQASANAVSANADTASGGLPVDAGSRDGEHTGAEQRALEKVDVSGPSVAGERTLAGPTATPTNGATSPAPIVEVQGLNKAFGGIVAVRDLTMTLETGCVTGLIGPNGAGKTTIFNLLTGAIRPDTGTVYLRGQDITGWSLNRVANRGMVRSFQDVRVYANLSPLDNVLMAVHGKKDEREARATLVTHLSSEEGQKAPEVALEYLKFVGMADKARQLTGSLPFGEQKLVALARVLAAEPDVLLLDEPASGIDHHWIDRMVELIARLRDRGLAICLVEHNLEVVGNLADRVYFLEAGHVTAEGSMQELSREQRLIEAYFGATA